MYKTLFLLLAMACGAGAPALSHAVERVAVGASFSHIYEQREDGSWHGLGVDVLRLLAERAGDTMRFKLYPWPRAMAMVERAQADILVGPYKSPERLKRLAYTDHALYRDRVVFYGRRSGPAAWRGDLALLKGKRIATVRGWHYGSQFEQARPLFDINEVPQVENGLQMLALGRIDLLATNERNVTRALGPLGLGASVTALCPDITQLDGYLAFPRAPHYAAVRERYNALFAQMVRSGELARLGVRNGVRVPPYGAAARVAPPCMEKAR
ncbi:transporter substrate-binding domain-containing protein [Duganella sp. FT50W]|uniref:Transporter substrate-binding domain-containing protein n=1 Tax=Duganella lactea TaxID=2692173 RepID=A0A6L8MFB7_9BURK|nr:transporter substrate-binding domain-containing protein [Duganella lactea]MYM81620.1 transporter substrate-binding domain-containing protein [Duganella lactea]